MSYTPSQEQRFDHQRDLRKNGDLNDFPDRMNKPLTTAMDIVVLVKALANYGDCAALIDSYAAMAAAAARADEAQIAADRLQTLKVPNV